MKPNVELRGCAAFAQSRFSVGLYITKPMKKEALILVQSNLI